MNSSIPPEDRAVPVISMEMILPMVDDFFWCISLDQTMDLALGKPDAQTKSSLKELLMRLVKKCTAFVLSNIRKKCMRPKDVDAVVGDVLLKSFADALEIKTKVLPKSFNAFNELFIKHVKHMVRSSISSVKGQEPSFVLQHCETNAAYLMLPLALKVIEELLIWTCKEHRQRERDAAKSQENFLKQQQTRAHPNVQSEARDSQTVAQNVVQDALKKRRTRRSGKPFLVFFKGRYMNVVLNLLPTIPEEPELEEATAEETDRRNTVPENQESDLKMVDKLISEELQRMTEENDLISKKKESDLKMVDEIISEELQRMTEENDLISKKKESDVKMADISEEASELTKFMDLISKENESSLKIVDDFISEVLSEVREVKEILSEQQNQTVAGTVRDPIQTTENRSCNEQAAPPPIGKQKNKEVGVEVRTVVGKYSRGRSRSVAPETALDLPEELEGQKEEVPSVRNSIPEDSNIPKGVNLADGEQESKDAWVEKSVSKESWSSIMLLVNAFVMQAVSESKLHCRYKNFQALTKKLSERIWTEVEGQELKNVQNSLNKLSNGILRGVSKKIGCSKKDVLLLMALNQAAVDEAIVSVFKEKILKPAKKTTFLTCLRNFARKIFLKPQ